MRQKQKGMVLVVSLILLVVMTLIGISSMQNTTLEERMAGNSRDRDLALKGAEAAVGAGETFLGGIAATGNFNGTNGLLALTTNDYSPTDFYTSLTTWNGTNTVTYASGIPELAASTKYIIKQVGLLSGENASLLVSGYGERPSAGNVTLFKVTGYSSGRSGSSRSVVQTYFGRAF